MGLLLNRQSSYHAFDPEITFLIVDLMELLGHELWGQETGEADSDNSKPGENREISHLPLCMRGWFMQLDGCIDPGRLYYLSDAWLWGPEIGALPRSWVRQQLEDQWLQGVLWLRQRHENIRVFPYRQIIGALGEENSFSLKMWYMGKILHTNEAQKRLAQEIAALGRRSRESLKRCCWWIWTIPCGAAWQESGNTDRWSCPRIIRAWRIRMPRGC